MILDTFLQVIKLHFLGLIIGISKSSLKYFCILMSNDLNPFYDAVKWWMSTLQEINRGKKNFG